MQGIIKSVSGNSITVDNGPLEKVNYPHPSAFSDTFIFEDDVFQEQKKNISPAASFGKFKQFCRRAIEKEIDYVRSTGGKKYRIIDGVSIQKKNGVYLYSFETDAELHFYRWNADNGTNALMYSYCISKASTDTNKF